MGRVVANAGKRDWDELTAEYGAMVMQGLGVLGTRAKHVNRFASSTCAVPAPSR
jgi:uncharacterized protein YbgA (DUF1722 family)